MGFIVCILFLRLSKVLIIHFCLLSPSAQSAFNKLLLSKVLMTLEAELISTKFSRLGTKTALPL